MSILFCPFTEIKMSISNEALQKVGTFFLKHFKENCPPLLFPSSPACRAWLGLTSSAEGSTELGDLDFTQLTDTSSSSSERSRRRPLWPSSRSRSSGRSRHRNSVSFAWRNSRRPKSRPCLQTRPSTRESARCMSPPSNYLLIQSPCRSSSPSPSPPPVHLRSVVVSLMSRIQSWLIFWVVE